VAARFFVDENDLALGKALAETHDDIVYPGHPYLPEVPRGSLDDDWLPIIGRKSLVVITRDQHIRYRPVEKRMWVDHGVRGFGAHRPPEPNNRRQSRSPRTALAEDCRSRCISAAWAVDVRRHSTAAARDPSWSDHDE